MISNPVEFTIKDTRTKFTYGGGNLLYHFSPHDCGIEGYENYMAVNVIFFANNNRHAVEVLENMLKFAAKHSKESLEPNKAQILLNNKLKWKIVPAPVNQFYLVGWADNDTLF